MPDTFMIGLENTVYDLLPLENWLETTDIPIRPDWTFKQYATASKLGDGKLKGQGFPIAVWRWNHMTNANREVFRTFCLDLSATVYIHTPTNESSAGDLIWKTFQAMMNWTPEDEDKQVDQTIGFILTFTHLIEQE